MRIDLDVESLNGVTLFPLTVADVSDEYVRWLNDPVVNEYLESRFASHDLVSTRSFVEAMVESPDNLLLGIRSEEIGAHVGNIKIGPVNRHHLTGEIGILIGAKQAWGRGIATAAIRIMCDIARLQLSLRKVTAGCYATNVGSQKAFEKAGFEVEGVRKQQILRRDGTPEDIVLLGKLLT